MSVLWISHRGESHDAPENTLSSFRLAAERKTDGCETDIHFTSDGVVVCAHDDNTGRMGSRKAVIAETPFAELETIDVSGGRAGFRGERIPKFEETFSCLAPGMMYFVEIKSGLIAMPKAMIEIIDRSGFGWDRIITIGFDPAVIAEFKRLAPNHKALLLIGETPSAEDLIAQLRSIHADGVDFCVSEKIDAEYVTKLKQAGFFVTVWTIDDLPTAKQYVGYGVDAVTSNRAAYLKKNIAGL